MSIESELNPHYYRTESTAEINPLQKHAGKEEVYSVQEKNFLKRLSEALEKLQQRDDMQGFCFVIERQEHAGLVVVMRDESGHSVARLTPEHCFYLAEKSHAEGLLVEVQC